MQHLGRVTNHAHNGLFVILCDASAQYGGWDDYGEVLGDDGSMELALGELRAYVEEGDCRHGGAVQVYRGNDGVLWIAPAAEPGVVPLPVDRIEDEPRTEIAPMGTIDLPTGTLTIATAYPALNLEATGDHAGLAHDDGERLDIAVAPGAWTLAREFTAVGQIISLRPVPQ